MTTTQRSYTATVYEAEPDEGGFWAEVPELPGCVAQGETLDELLGNLRDAIEAWEQTSQALDGEPPRRPYATVTVSLHPDPAA